MHLQVVAGSKRHVLILSTTLPPNSMPAALSILICERLVKLSSGLLKLAQVVYQTPEWLSACGKCRVKPFRHLGFTPIERDFCN